MENKSYNSSAPGVVGSLFGLPHSVDEAEVVIYPVPWDATVSYHSGTSYGPKAILDASSQLDLEIVELDAPWKRGIAMMPIEGKIKSKNDILREQIIPYIKSLEGKGKFDDKDELLSKVNNATSSLRTDVEKKTLNLIQQGKLVGVLGGDHSCPLGFLDALGSVYSSFGILQIDAHMDLRKAYEGFEHSHASIMYNALNNPSISKLVQVGIRDYCEEEVTFIDSCQGKVKVFYDQLVKRSLFEGVNWATISEEIVSSLPKQVYISLDIDGLEPVNCFGTGTPVPGGLTFDEVIYLLHLVKRSGREVIGFDLCEVAPKVNDAEWNANVGARLLYHLCGLIGT